MMGSTSVISLVPAYKNGFLTRIDYAILRRDAESCNVNVSLLARPGDHVVEGAPLAQVRPEQRADAVAKALRDHGVPAGHPGHCDSGQPKRGRECVA